MSILPSAQQKAVLDSKADVTFVSCSAGAGASTTALMLGAASETSATIVGSSLRGVNYTADWYCDKFSDTCERTPDGVIIDGKYIRLIGYSEYLENTGRHPRGHLIFDYAGSLPKDFLKDVGCEKLTIFSVPTLEKKHPVYKMAKNMNRPYIFFQDGFPFFADKVESLDDVFGDGYSFETHRMSYLENTQLTNSCPQYAENINCMPNLERKRLKGYWSFEDVLNY